MGLTEWNSHFRNFITDFAIVAHGLLNNVLKQSIWVITNFPKDIFLGLYDISLAFEKVVLGFKER